MDNRISRPGDFVGRICKRGALIVAAVLSENPATT